MALRKEGRPLAVYYKHLMSSFLYFYFQIESPRIHSIVPVHQFVNETRNFTIFCNATGYPLPKIIWRRAGNSSVILSSEKTLTVQNVGKSDIGTYDCTIVSVSGENVTAEASVELDFCKSFPERCFSFTKWRIRRT